MTLSQRSALLLVAYYFPPLGLGGVQRPLKLAKYLPEFGWDVTVVTPHAGRYYQNDESLLAELPATVRVERVNAFDPAHLFAGRLGLSTAADPSSLKSQGRRLREWLRWPDDKVGFVPSALRRIRRLRSQSRYDLVWTSSPPPSEHMIGLRLRRRIGWIADFRDPWSLRAGDWGPTPLHAAYGRRLRRRIARNADRIVAVNDAIARTLDHDGARRPSTIIHNGYDEADFASSVPTVPADQPFTILCPGTFGNNSDPEPIFRMVRQWREVHPGQGVLLVHVGASFGVDSPALAERAGLADVFRDEGYVDHAKVIVRQRVADCLVISISDREGFSENVPGRLFEALRTFRPLLVLGPLQGETAKLVGPIPGCHVVAPDDTAGAAQALDAVMRLPRMTPARAVADIRLFDRREQARRLAALCDEIKAERAVRLPVHRTGDETPSVGGEGRRA